MAVSLIDSEMNIRCKLREIDKLNGQICDAVKKLDVKEWDRLSFGMKQCTQGLNIRIKGHATDQNKPQRKPMFRHNIFEIPASVELNDTFIKEKTQRRDMRGDQKQEVRLLRKIYSGKKNEFIELIDEGTQTTDTGQVVAFVDKGSLSWGPVKNRKGWCFRKVQIGFISFTQT